MKTKLLQLSEICTTAGTQIRARIDADSVSDYADAMTDGAKFPPVVVFHDGSEYILADGFHRVMACSRNGFKDIEADVRKGTKSDALKYALGANSAHGIKRSPADKRRSIELAMAEWPKLSNREIAKVCVVDDHTVSSVRKDMEATAEIPQLDTRIGADGKERKMPKRKESPTTPEDDEDQEQPHIVQHTPDEIIHEVAAKVEPSVTEYYSRLQDLMLDAIANATDKQLASMSVYAAMMPKLIKDEQRRRKVGQ